MTTGTHSICVFVLLFCFVVQQCLCDCDRDQCQPELLQGFQCGSDSAAVNCYRSCSQQYMRNYADYLKTFEDAACQKGLENEFRNDRNCWSLVFPYCKDLAVKPSNQESVEACKIGKAQFKACTRPVQNDACMRALETLKTAVEDLVCGASNIVVHVTLISVATLVATMASWI